MWRISHNFPLYDIHWYPKCLSHLLQPSAQMINKHQPLYAFDPISLWIIHRWNSVTAFAGILHGVRCVSNQYTCTRSIARTKRAANAAYTSRISYAEHPPPTAYIRTLHHTMHTVRLQVRHEAAWHWRSACSVSVVTVRPCTVLAKPTTYIDPLPSIGIVWGRSGGGDDAVCMHRLAYQSA